LVQFLLILGTEFDLAKVNHDLIERAGKLERNVVIFADRRAGVLAYVR
jgi:hypothetical protein